jgi:iron complex transport system ATP-binding protein
MIYEINNLYFSYPNQKRTILQGVSFSLQEGEILTILGPNGSGKSTLLNCMANLLYPTNGSILLNGKNVQKMNAREIANIISYVPQKHSPTFSYTVLNYVIMGCAPKIGLFSKPKEKDEAAAYHALERLGISYLADKPYNEISGGELQQVTIARAIVQEPKAILFDEPTAHLDYGNQIRILRLIKEMANDGYSIVITTHNPDHAILLGGTVAILDRHGCLEIGKYNTIITESRLKKVYNADLRLLMIPELSRIACLPPNL